MTEDTEQNKFGRYPSLKALGHTEVAGILDGTIEITEKYDGANMRITVKADGSVYCGGRNHEVQVAEAGKQFEFQGGIGSWVQNDVCNGPLGTILNDLSTCYQGREVVLVAEWMQKHTVDYGITKPYPIFYDVYVEGKGLLPHAERQEWMGYLKDEGYSTAPVLYFGPGLPVSEIESRFMGKQSNIARKDGVMGEGIVIKNPNFTNQFGRQCHAKWVNPEFKETASTGKRVQDPNNQSDYSVVVEEIVTRARLVKLLAKRGVEPSLKEMSWLSKTMVEDCLVEEILRIKESCNVLDFGRFTQQACYRTVRLINELLIENAAKAQSTVTCNTGVIDGTT